MHVTNPKSLRVCIIGAGIGGLTCAIACRREGLSVQVLEQAPEILPVGAGIQVPPNATKILDRLGILAQVRAAACEVQTIRLRRYQDGSVLTCKPIEYQTPWFVIHRADYHQVLMDKAIELGVQICPAAKVESLDFHTGDVLVDDGRVFSSDVIIGADGLWSTVRTKMLGYSSAPEETGDLAYRATFTRKQLEALNDPSVTALCNERGVTVWLGPDKHCVFYQVRGGDQMNMVLLRPDNLAPGTRTDQGDLGEMRQTFKDWDGVLTKLISCISSVLKWKLMHHGELDSWVKGRVALLGDACHPTLPYQAQGAAMAVEDGAILGRVLGRLNQEVVKGRVPDAARSQSITEALRVYERSQKRRTTTNVQGAVNNRHFYHMVDGPQQQRRDSILANHTWTDEASEYAWCDMGYNDKLLNVDVLGDVDKAFNSWPTCATRLSGVGQTKC